MANRAGFSNITGSTHIDKFHNWILYYDSYYERMSPIIWDPVGWRDVFLKKDVNLITTSLFESLYHNGEFLRKKYAVLNHFYLEVQPTMGEADPAIRLVDNRRR